MDIFRLVLGAAILTMGRRLYWLFLGGVGFVFGFDLTKQIVHNQPQEVTLIIALCAGVAGALLAIFFQKVAILVGGFLAGGYLFVELLRELGKSPGNYYLLLFVVGGVIGALLMKLLFRWTLIILSSFIGAGLIGRSLHLGLTLTKPLFIVLFVLGIAIQSGLISAIYQRRG